MSSTPMFPPPPGIKNTTENAPHPLFLAHQPPPPGLLQILMSAEKCQVSLIFVNFFYLSVGHYLNKNNFNTR